MIRIRIQNVMVGRGRVEVRNRAGIAVLTLFPVWGRRVGGGMWGKDGSSRRSSRWEPPKLRTRGGPSQSGGRVEGGQSLIFNGSEESF